MITCLWFVGILTEVGLYGSLALVRSKIEYTSFQVLPKSREKLIRWLEDTFFKR